MCGLARVLSVVRLVGAARFCVRGARQAGQALCELCCAPPDTQRPATCTPPPTRATVLLLRGWAQWQRQVQRHRLDALCVRLPREQNPPRQAQRSHPQFREPPKPRPLQRLRLFPDDCRQGEPWGRALAAAAVGHRVFAAANARQASSAPAPQPGIVRCPRVLRRPRTVA